MAKDTETASPSELIDARIRELPDWRGETLARLRELIKLADPDVVEQWKWRGVLKGLFNSSLEGNTRRAIYIGEDDEVDESAFTALIRAAVALNTQ
jgi:hypothetical protein